MTIPRSRSPGFFKPSLWDRGMVTDVWGRKYVWKKKDKIPVCETVVWSLADRVENLIEKNDPVCQWYGHWLVKKKKSAGWLTSVCLSAGL